jgi:hypothetical protein
MISEEKIRILKMVESGKISAEEGATLLEAIEETPEEKASGQQSSLGRILNIKVTNSETGEAKVNLKVPLGVAHIIKSLIPAAELQKLQERGINLDLLFQNIDSGAIGQLIDVEDKEHNQIIQISIE